MSAVTTHSPSPKVSDVNVLDTAVLPAPEYLARELPRTEAQADLVVEARRTIDAILFGTDKRLLVVVGPCSIHDPKAGMEYARRLARLAEELKDRIYLVMRVYFEKPRTTVGWKGLIMDPHLDGSGDIPAGLKLARKLLREVLDTGLPTATELLDPITPQYIADLICWSAVGARTSESQTHRQMASGLSMPLGFKNTTSGAIQPAINAIKAAREPQTFLGISFQGLASAVSTRGNESCHLILRGSDKGPNYDRESLHEAASLLEKNGLPVAMMVDCAHGNSAKDQRRQPLVMREAVEALLCGQKGVIGSMIESNLIEGKQSFPRPKEELVEGQSITDPCLSWEDTEALLREVYERVAERF